MYTPVKPVNIYQPQTATQPSDISPLPFFSPIPTGTGTTTNNNGNVPTTTGMAVTHQSHQPSADLTDILDRIDDVINSDVPSPPPSLQHLPAAPATD